MWGEQLAENRVRREHLVACSQALREAMGQHSQALQTPLALADRVRGGFHWLASHPQWLVLPIALTVAMRPRRVLGWSMKLWWGWRALRRVQGLLPR
ncbi:MAG: YqjK family protein [Ramlibacter sp.]